MFVFHHTSVVYKISINGHVLVPSQNGRYIVKRYIVDLTNHKLVFMKKLYSGCCKDFGYNKYS